MLQHLGIYKTFAAGCILVCVLIVSFHRAEDLTIKVAVQDLPKVLKFFETCYLRNELPASDREVQQHTTKELDASVKFKGYLMRLPEGDKPIQYMPLEFWFLMKLPLNEDTVVLALMGKCFSLMIVLERDYKKLEYELDFEETDNTKNSAFRIREIAFHNEKKSGHCEVKNPNFGTQLVFKPDEQYFSCPREQMFSCRRFNLTDEEAAGKPNKFDLLVVEHLEIGLDNKLVAGDQFSKKVKTCDLE